MMSAATRLGRVLVVLAACTAAATGTWRLAEAPLLALVRPLVADGPAALQTLPFPVVLAGGCAAALVGSTGRLLGGAALLALGRLVVLVLPGRPLPAACARLAERACPRIARGVVVGVLGLALGSAVATPALADASGASPGDPAASTLDGLTVPDRATGSASSAASRTNALPAPRSVRVRPGDSLWSIAVRLLPPEAGDARVTTAWHALHRTNRARIGDDPDLILPGTRLVVPDLDALEPTASHREEHP